jgi:hypothetical protein
MLPLRLNDDPRLALVDLINDFANNIRTQSPAALRGNRMEMD